MLGFFLKTAVNVYKECVFYRANLILSMLIEVIPLIGFLKVTETVYDHGYVIGSYSKAQALTYYLCTRFMSDFVMPVEWWSIVEGVRSDGLSFHLTKPYSYFWMEFVSYFASKFIYYFFSLIVLVALLFFWGNQLYLPTLLHVLYAVLIFLLSSIMAFQLTFLISISAFWLGENSFIGRFIHWVLPIFLGTIFPLSAFPEPISTVLVHNPFQYLLFFPTEVFLGRKNAAEISNGIGMQIFWIFLLFLLIRLTWRKGLKRYLTLY